MVTTTGSRELHEAYFETTARSGRKYWVFLDWSEMPDMAGAVKVTRKFAYFDTPLGRERFRL